MIKQMNSMPLAVLALMVSSVSLSVHAFSDVRYAPRVTDLATGQATPAQGKTVVLDVPLIAERVNEVVVNVGRAPRAARISAAVLSSISAG